MDDRCELSLILPAFNEEAGIARAIVEADEALARLGRRYEIVVVDDGSADRTADIVQQLAPDRPRVRLVRHDTNRGYGAALRTGFMAARGERIAFTDADCQFHLDDLASLVALTDTHPIAVGYRADRQDPAPRRLYSRGYNLLARFLLGTGVRDVDCALKVFRRDALAKLLPESNGFFVNTEMLTKARQLRMEIADRPVRHRRREDGESKVSLVEIPRTLNVLLPFWWMRVMFPGRSEPEAAAKDDTAPSLTLRAQWILMALLLVVTCALFFARLNHVLLEPEEARYAEIPRQMLMEGRLSTPVLNGEDYWQKPPLLYWLIMLSYQIFGVHDWAARLVPALAGIGTIMIVTLWAWRTLGFWSGFVSGVMAALSARFLYLSGMLSMDGLLCTCVLAGLACGHLALIDDDRRRRWLMLSAIACALGVLTKGPVAILLITLPLALFVYFDRRVRFPSRGQMGFYLFVVTLLAGPWFLLMAWQAPRDAGAFFWIHNLSRYFAPIDHEKPAWFYVPSLVLGMLPWTLLALPFIPYLLRRSASAGRRRPAPLGFFLLAFVWCVGFFSLSGCKRPAYILPAFPLLAMMLGCFVTHGLPWRRLMSVPEALAKDVAQRWARRLASTAALMGVTVSAAAALTELWNWREAAAASALFALVGTAVICMPTRLPPWTSWAGTAAVVCLFLGMGQMAWLPDYHQRFGLRRQVEISGAFEEAEDLPILSYPKRYDSVGFYTRRTDIESYTPAELTQLMYDLHRHGKALVFVRREGSLAELLAALPNHLEVELLDRDGDYVAVGLVRPRQR